MRPGDPGAPPPFELIEPGDDPTAGPRARLLPEPDDGDVFLDFEGHPFWRADVGLFFLFGSIERDDDRRVGATAARWAHDRSRKRQRSQALVDYLAARRSSHPNMHVYHYNHTERSSLERLTTEHGVAELELDRLIETGMFVDLFRVVTTSCRPAPSATA